MHKIAHALFVLALCPGIFLSRESGHRSYQEYLKRYKAYKRMYYGQFQPGKISGWCDYSPKWTVNGINPVYDEVSRGHHVLLYLLRRDCKSCFHELNGLHLLAEYYRKIKNNVTIIALNKRWRPLARNIHYQFPYIKIYEEPNDKDLFLLLKGKVGDIFIYDRCGRRLYFFRYPYSSLIHPFVRNAVQNTEYHYERLCGDCINRSLRSIPTSVSTIAKRSTPENKMISIQLCDNSQNSSTKGEIRYLDFNFNSKRLIDLHVFKMGNKMNSTSNVDGVNNNNVFNIETISKERSNLPAYKIKSVHITSTTRKKIIIHKIDGPYN